MSAMATEEMVDLSDLDLLDDPHRHIYCAFCMPPGVPRVGIARCGKRGLCHGKYLLEGIPENVCAECSHHAAVLTPCPRCGR